MLEINLLPWRSDRRKKQKKTKIIFSALGASVIFSILIFTYFFASHKASVMRERYALLKNTLSLAEEQAKNAKKMEHQLRHIKWIGYLHQDNRTWAVLMLPNGKIQDVKIGTNLEIGNAKVINITENHLVLALSNHQIILTR